MGLHLIQAAKISITSEVNPIQTAATVARLTAVRNSPGVKAARSIKRQQWELTRIESKSQQTTSRGSRPKLDMNLFENFQGIFPADSRSF